MSDISLPSRPRSIDLFELLAYLAYAAGICALFVGVAEVIVLQHYVSDDAVTPWDLLAVVWLVPMLTRPWLIFAAARLHRNWAKWLYAVLATIDVVVTFLPWPDFTWRPIGVILTMLILSAELAAVYFAFSQESAAWFQPGRPLPRS